MAAAAIISSFVTVKGEHGARLNRVAPRLSLAPLRAVISGERRSLETTGQRAARALRRIVEFRRQRFDSVSKLVESLSYKSALSRGFALVKNDKGQLIHAAAAVKLRQALTIQFADGEVKVREDGARQGSLF